MMIRSTNSVNGALASRRLCMRLPFSFAALPPDVRQVSDLPSRSRLRGGWAEPTSGRSPQEERAPARGKAQPLHTSGGRAAHRRHTYEPFGIATTTKAFHRLDLSNVSSFRRTHRPLFTILACGFDRAWRFIHDAGQPPGFLRLCADACQAPEFCQTEPHYCPAPAFLSNSTIWV
jgi:hypothetical protein